MGSVTSPKAKIMHVGIQTLIIIILPTVFFIPDQLLQLKIYI